VVERFGRRNGAEKIKIRTRTILLEQKQVIRIPRAVEDRLSCAQRAVRLSIHSSTAYAEMTKRETPFNHSLPTPLSGNGLHHNEIDSLQVTGIGPEQRDKKFVWQIIYA